MVLAVVAVSVVTATPLKLNPPFLIENTVLKGLGCNRQIVGEKENHHNMSEKNDRKIWKNCPEPRCEHNVWIMCPLGCEGAEKGISESAFRVPSKVLSKIVLLSGVLLSALEGALPVTLYTESTPESTPISENTREHSGSTFGDFPVLGSLAL